MKYHLHQIGMSMDSYLELISISISFSFSISISFSFSISISIFLMKNHHLNQNQNRHQKIQTWLVNGWWDPNHHREGCSQGLHQNQRPMQQEDFSGMRGSAMMNFQSLFSLVEMKKKKKKMMMMMMMMMMK